MVVTKGLEAMRQLLGWDTARTSALLQACEAQLSMRLRQIQAMQSISNTQLDGSREPNATSTEEAAKTPAQGSS